MSGAICLVTGIGDRATADELASKKLIMVVRVDGASDPITPDQLQLTLIKSLEKSGCACSGEPRIQRISPTFYDEFSKIVDKADPPRQKNSPVKIEPIFVEAGQAEFPLMYDLTLPEPGQVIDSLHLVYDAGEPEDLSLKDANRLQKIAVDSMQRPVYRVLLKSLPIEYKVTATPSSGSAKQFGEAWPQFDIHFAITMDDFTGEWEQLRATLLDPEKVANELSDILNVSDTRFVLAAIGRKIGTSDPGSVKGLLIVGLDSVAGKPIDKIWVKLPLTLEQLKKELDGFNGLTSGDKVIERMRDSGEAKNLMPLGSPEPESYPVIDSNGDGKWYGLSTDSDRKRFTGVLALGDREHEAQLRKQFPEMFMLVIQEMDNEAVAYSLPIEQDPTRDRGNATKAYYATPMVVKNIGFRE